MRGDSLSIVLQGGRASMIMKEIVGRSSDITLQIKNKLKAQYRYKGLRRIPSGTEKGPFFVYFILRGANAYCWTLTTLQCTIRK